jgi:hypothetical protein
LNKKTSLKIFRIFDATRIAKLLLTRLFLKIIYWDLIRNFRLRRIPAYRLPAGRQRQAGSSGGRN